MIRDAATQRQIDAANPKLSTWLLANAGSGKTRVLTDRVARLLLEDVSPQNILCLTYTKAAASEMQNRLFARLGKWAMMPDTELRLDLQKLGLDRDISAKQLRDARTLFARAVETPGGLKIQTIHSFCAGLLRRFPLEANVSPQFREMEDREAKTLRENVMDGLISGEHRHLVQTMLAYFTGDDLSRLTAEIASKRDYFTGEFDEAALRTLLDLGHDQNRQSALGLAFNGTEAEISADLLEAFSDQSATYQKFAQTIKKLNFAAPERRDLNILFDLFLYKGSGASKSVNFPQSNHSKAVTAMAPIAAEVHDWMDRVAQAKQMLWSFDALDKTKAMHSFGAAFMSAYEVAKTKLAVLDFDDLIRKAKSLLVDPNVAQWVLFRLDGGIDHILVDEAQDTSPTQWSVIKELSQEFAAGLGAQPDRERTIFVVGDKKQSIYSFQGADPAAFDQMKTHFQKTHREAIKPFEVTSLDHSFRSAQTILSVVDATFDRQNSLGSDGQPSHIAFRSNLPGRVDLWPVIESTKQDDQREWFKPVDEPSATDHNILMAERIADQISHMIKHETLPTQIPNSDTYAKRSITEGDFLILVQRRSELFAEIIRACKAAGLEVAGADRLRVGAELAVKDINALLNFLALPEDDLSLAAALRSPLFNWTEQELFTLAHHRPKNTYLWAALRASEHNETLELLNDLRRNAEFLRPYELIERILIRHNGRRNLLARLGPEAEDGIDALLAQALNFEKSNIPSLTSFLSWVQTDELEVKRQMDNQGDRIRVMTVHGAKGLEAPIVILPDAAKREVKINDELLVYEDQVVWKTPVKESSDAVNAVRNLIIAKQAQERARLLYVAMTRAEKWLIVGAAGDIGDDKDSWYNMVCAGMEQRGTYQAKMNSLSMERVSDIDWDRLEKQTTPETEHVAATPLALCPITEPIEDITISPSNLPGPKALPGELNYENVDDLLAYGVKLHLLLEHLPTVEASKRTKVGKQLVGEENAHIITKAVSLIDDPLLVRIWRSDALAEVEVTADVAGLGQVFGAIDRLIVTTDAVQIIDFKSNRTVPANLLEAPLGVVNQLAAYFAAIQKIYPDRKIEAFILWTHTGDLMKFPEQDLHDALKALTSS